MWPQPGWPSFGWDPVLLWLDFMCLLTKLTLRHPQPNSDLPCFSSGPLAHVTKVLETCPNKDKVGALYNRLGYTDCGTIEELLVILGTSVDEGCPTCWRHTPSSELLYYLMKGICSTTGIVWRLFKKCFIKYSCNNRAIRISH